MALSKRAMEYLAKSERETSELPEEVLLRIFSENNVPVFEPLIEFQRNYGGYIFYAGLEPIKFSLFKGGGGYPLSNYRANIEFEDSEMESCRYLFDCATTNYQMQFFLDEEGVYYEDYEPVASSFEKSIEHLALWKEMGDDYEVVFRYLRLATNKPEIELGLELIPEASDQFTQWFKNEFIYMVRWQDKTTIIASSRYPDKAKLLELRNTKLP